MSQLTAADIQRLAAAGESQIVEFKQEGETQTDLGELLISLANADGGTILVGVTDDGVVNGCPNPPVIRRKLLAASRMTRPPMEDITEEYFVTVNNNEVFVVHVPARRDAVYSYSTTFRIRRGSRNEQIDGVELTRLARIRSGNDFEDEPLPELSLADLDPSTIADMRAGRARLGGLVGTGGTDSATLPQDDVAFLTKLGGVVQYGQRVVPTVAGLLAMGRNPQDALPQSILQAARFHGSTPADIMDRQLIAGSVPQQVEALMNFVARNSMVAARIVGTYREDIPQYPPEALREAVANALSHRSYFDVAYRVQVNIFAERIEVISPGGVLPGIDLSSFRGFARRNPHLAEMLSLLRVVESWGTGLARMRAAMEKAGLPPPVFEDDQYSVRVVLFSREPQASDEAAEFRTITRAALPSRSSGLNKRQEEVIATLREAGGSTTAPQYGSRFDISNQQAREDLVMMVEKGILERSGLARSTRYYLAGRKEATNPPAESE